jgi:two-component system NtrC family sensor kinase
MDKPFAEHMPRDGHDEDKMLRQLAANEKMAELGRLSAGIVHEINTPLSVIAAASQMILREQGLTDAVVEMVERIHQEVQRLSGLTRGILSFSRMEEVPDSDADVNLVLRDVMDMLKYEIRKRSIRVFEEYEPHLPSIQADANLLKQIFLNLIVNALQAMKTGGSLFISTSSTGDGLTCVMIRDTGTGISDEILNRIFEPFFSTKDPGEGTGLGLYITRTNVERLGGRIEVESVEGKGTCFTLFFPSGVEGTAEDGCR